MLSPSPDSGTEMALVGSPSSNTYGLSNSPTASTSPSSLEEFKYLQYHSPSYHSDEGIGIEFVKKERTRKRKVRLEEFVYIFSSFQVVNNQLI
jgi:hypothetical protein